MYYLLSNLTVGSPVLITSEKITRTFEVSLRPDKKYEVLDKETGKEYAINIDSVETLTKKSYEEAEALEILIFIKEAFEKTLNMSYADISAALEKISEVYASPDWVIGEIENMTIGQLLDIFKSDEPVRIFKNFAD